MSLPYAPNSTTSREAAESIEAEAPKVAEVIWRAALGTGAYGITADEMIAALEGRVSANTVRPRIVALKYSGLLVRHPDGLTRPTRSNRLAEVWVARQGDFHALYREPPPRNREAEEALGHAARRWVAAHGQEDEQTALEDLLDAAWAAYGQGPRPKPWQDDEDWAQG